jgi:hypothetical protein
LQQHVLGYAIKGNLDRCLARLVQSPDDLPWLARVADLAEVVRSMNIEINLWKTQNLCFKMLKTVAPERKARAEQGDAASAEWLQHFNKLSEQLGFKLNGCAPQ